MTDRISIKSVSRCLGAPCCCFGVPMFLCTLPFPLFYRKMLYFIVMKEIQTYQSLLDHIQQKDAISGIAQPPSCGSVPNCIV